MTLSQSDRALIDAALAAGRVQVVPVGASAFPVPVWRGDRLVLPDGGREVLARIYGRTNRVAKAADFRAKVLAAHHNGMLPGQIATLLRAGEAAVRGQLSAAGMSPNILDREERRARMRAARQICPHVVARRRRVLGLMSAGIKLATIARQLGLHYEVVKYDARVLRAGAAGAETLRVA